MQSRPRPRFLSSTLSTWQVWRGPKMDHFHFTIEFPQNGCPCASLCLERGTRYVLVCELTERGCKCRFCLQASLHKYEPSAWWLFIRDPPESCKIGLRPRCCNCCLSKHNCFLSKHFKAPRARLISLRVGGGWEWWMNNRTRLMACRHRAFISIMHPRETNATV